MNLHSTPTYLGLWKRTTVDSVGPWCPEMRDYKRALGVSSFISGWEVMVYVAIVETGGEQLEITHQTM